MTLEQKNLPERFPSKEEIQSVFERLVQGRKYKELRALSNTEGLYLYEIEVILENGEKEEYNYQKANYDYRDKSLPDAAQFAASIHAIYYDADGMPVSSKCRCVANYRDGEWHYVSTEEKEK